MMDGSCDQPVHIVGGGLAGCEAAWQLARAGVAVVLHEMRPLRQTPAHHSDRLAELVCSNSFRSDDADRSAIGLLHEEMRRLGSLILDVADARRLPAGTALAVDRDGFSAEVTHRIESEALIAVERGEIEDPFAAGWRNVIIATGPLTSDALAARLAPVIGNDGLAFFDAIAPIVYTESIDFEQAWFQSRYDKGGGRDYINCPLDRTQYEAFIEALLAADRVSFREWEQSTPYFEGCLPIEVMAERGPRTLAFGPMKAVGLTNPRDGRRPYAVVQLRQDNALGTLYNIVGFQTKLKHAEQMRVFRMIPGLQRAEFARLGGLHRNTFINSPKLLDERLRLRARPEIRFAGQITGCEGYVESAAIGLLAGRFAAADVFGLDLSLPPATTAIGSLLRHLTDAGRKADFQPMNVNFGLFPPLAAAPASAKAGGDRKAAYCRRALAELDDWIADSRPLGAQRIEAVVR